MQDLTALVKKAQRGDLEAFDTLVKRYRDMAVGYAYSILGEKENACESLKTAVARGFSDIELLKNDADLINIRENKCYKKILRGLEATFDFAR